MNRLNLAWLLALAIAAASHAADAPTVTPPMPANPATLSHTQSFDMVSPQNGEAYRIKVYVPPDTPPAGGYPAIYVLDGGNLFGTFAAAVGNEAGAKERAQAVIVGIEDAPGANGADRTYDFTPFDLSDREKQIVVDLGPDPKFGGYEKFIRTVQEDIKARVAKIVPVDPHHETLLGWSLGGQVAVHTMLVHPEYFTCYVALSPSLWRSDRAVFKEVAPFKRTVVASGRRVSLFIGVGALEEEVSPGMAQWPIDQTKFAAEMKYARMVGNVRDFTTDLRPFFQQHGMAFESKIFADETHNTAPWAAVNPILRFVLPYGNPK